MAGSKKGERRGGRQKGTPNKRTVEIQTKLDALGCDPIAGMAAIALDEENSPELRARMFAELAQYVAPKRKAIEADVRGSVSGDIRLIWERPDG